MEAVVRRLGVWALVLLAAIIAIALTPDSGFAIHMGIVALVAVILILATLGTYDLKLRDRGFHCASDHLGRVVMSRLPEAVRIAIRFVEMLDTREFAFPEPTSR
jgi:hypothetical protein